MYQALYRKYRPKTLTEIGGQDTIVKIINNSITNNRINHAYLFAGPRGTGKTSIAKIFAKMVNCENLKNGIPCNKCVSCTQTNNSDIIEIDAASNNGVDEIRELRNKVNLVPSYGKYKVYIIDEVHMLTTGAFNALLKTLEEPPAHIIFILATTDPHKIPETILSRCQRLDFKKISNKSIVERLKEISSKENIKITDEALNEIARLSDGGMRDSIGLLDEATAYSDNEITIKDIHAINGTLTPQDLAEFLELIVDKKIEKILQKIDEYSESGKNFVKLTEEIINFIRNILLYQKAEGYFKSLHKDTKLYEKISSKIADFQLMEYIDRLNQGLLEMKTTNNPKLVLELTLIKILSNKNQNIVEKEPETNTYQKSVTTTQNQNTHITQTEIQKNENTVEKDQIITQQNKSSIQNINKVPITNEKVVFTPKNQKKLEELKQLRINNTLAKFTKKLIPITKQKLLELNNYLLDPDISTFASMLMDGTLKAASEENLIFVYSKERTAKRFNENIINLETTIQKILNKKYKIIATDINEWQQIKDDFNSRKKIYEYKEENINIEEIFTKNENNEFSSYSELIEYN